MSDTIAAVATGGVVSAIGVVRVSGNDALTVADNVFVAANGARVVDFKDRRLYYGEFTRQGDGSSVLPPSTCASAQFREHLTVIPGRILLSFIVMVLLLF